MEQMKRMSSMPASTQYCSARSMMTDLWRAATMSARLAMAACGGCQASLAPRSQQPALA